MNKPTRVNNLKYVTTDFPPKPKRDIKYALVREHNDVYFINQSNEVIKQVSTASFGFLTEDDTVYSPENNTEYTYEDVQPGEGVLVENYNDDRAFYDYMLGLYIYIKNKDGQFRINVNSHKGGVKSQILMYADGTTPRFISIHKV